VTEQQTDTESTLHANELAQPAEPPVEDAQAQETEPTEEAEQAGAELEGEAPAEDEDHLAPGQTEVPVGDEIVIDDVTMRRALEAILMVTDEPLPVLTLARTVGRPTADVTAALAGLSEEYTEQGRGFDLREVGGGWRYYTREEAALYVERFVLDGQQARLTQAALETLAVVAYKQPVSRARVSAIRGVNVDGVMRTLISRGLVEEAGADTESQATLYRTTSYFLERMGMQSLEDLPELAPYLPEMDDMEEELATHNNPHPEAEATPDPDATAHADEAVTSDVGAATADVDEAADDSESGDLDTESTEGELEPAEELEAGGETELEQEESDPAEIPEADDPAETDEDDESDEDEDEDVEGGDAEGESEPDPDAGDDLAGDVPGDDAGSGDAIELGEDAAETDADEFDQDDESDDEQLPPAEDLEAAGGELDESVPVTDETPLGDVTPASGAGGSADPTADDRAAAVGDSGSGGEEDAAAEGGSQYRVSDE